MSSRKDSRPQFAPAGPWRRIVGRGPLEPAQEHLMTLDVRDLFRKCASEPARRRPVLAVAIVALSAGIAVQQQPQLGIAPVSVSSTPYVFDTAEVHKIRV